MLAKELVKTSKNVDRVHDSKHVLQHADDTVRGNAMVAARRLVGGIDIEKGRSA